MFYMCIEKGCLQYVPHFCISTLLISIFQELSFSPVSSAELQSYISYSRKFKPYIPIKLTDYISGQYAELRAEEKEAGENSTGYSTARTLLSILRLSEAIARLRWSDEVSTLLQQFPVGVKLFLPRLRNLM
jgi:hypothetical protein